MAIVTLSMKGMNLSSAQIERTLNVSNETISAIYARVYLLEENNYLLRDLNKKVEEMATC